MPEQSWEFSISDIYHVIKWHFHLQQRTILNFLVTKKHVLLAEFFQGRYMAQSPTVSKSVYFKWFWFSKLNLQVLNLSWAVYLITAASLDIYWKSSLWKDFKASSIPSILWEQRESPDPTEVNSKSLTDLKGNRLYTISN